MGNIILSETQCSRKISVEIPPLVGMTTYYAKDLHRSGKINIINNEI